MLSDVFSDVNGLSWDLPELRRVSGALGDKPEQSARGGGGVEEISLETPFHLPGNPFQ